MTDAAQRHHHRLRTGRLHRRRLRRACQPAPAGLRGLGDRRRRADEHHRGRELPRLPRRHHGPGPDGRDAGQAERFGAELVADDIVEVDLTGEVKIVKTATDTYTARAVILAMGSGYRKLGLPDEEELSGRGVSWCATCDGFFFRDQHIAVVGGGDSAIEEATFLTRFGSKVTLIHRRDELRASKIMQERAFADPKLEFVWNSEVAAINGADRLESLTLRDTVTGETSELAGHRPVHRDRPRPALRAAHRARSTSTTTATSSSSTRRPHQPARRVRLRRPRRPPLPPGRHRRRHRLRGRPRRRALPRRPRPRRLVRRLGRGRPAAETQSVRRRRLRPVERRNKPSPVVVFD